MQAPAEEGYFMSQDEQDAVIGRVIRQHKEVSVKLGTLKAEAQRFGVMLVGVGEALRQHPEALLQQGESFRGEIIQRSPLQFPIDFPSAEKLQKLTTEIRLCLTELADLDTQRAALGI